MLETITVEDAKYVAELAMVARQARDRILDKIRDEDLGEPKPARGEHNPARALGLDPLPQDHPARLALRDAITTLPWAARSELGALLSIGQGNYAARDWEKALAAASAVEDEVMIGILLDEVDLHEYLMKGLYELGLG
jgi:hypothetical protein